MAFAVDWEDPPLAMLTHLWTVATDRAVITTASNLIDRSLRNDPDAAGSPLSEGLYVIEIPPLRATYEIDPVK